MQSLHEPMTVSQLWDAVMEWRKVNNANEPISFFWYSYALDVLYAMDLVLFQDSLIYRIDG